MRCRGKDYLTVNRQIWYRCLGDGSNSCLRHRLRNMTLRRSETLVREVVVSMPSTLKGSYIAGRGSMFRHEQHSRPRLQIYSLAVSLRCRTPTWARNTNLASDTAWARPGGFQLLSSWNSFSMRNPAVPKTTPAPSPHQHSIISFFEVQGKAAFNTTVL